ncbi:MAG: DUF4491 family protein [Clostridia bacterium]|nr:DUF4491 family protein [Clostridia bacterium]MBQ8511752.1 DUF4491 family protein [Clostridia bacterium]
MYYEGLIISVLTFLIIGLFHPIVIRAEYHFSKKIWPLFAVVGVVFIGLSLMTESTFAGTVLGVLGASSLWSIKELYEQENRVKKGWFPENPKRKDK